ncbi:MAG TPA: histidine kinase [Epulopiscium sp.]|nr:histidine kinase [Candidatus Epulonipiscium sp.]
MGSNKKKIFKKEIRKTFILYAVAPILIFTILSYNFLMLYGQRLIKNQNIATNNTVSALIEEELGRYIKGTEELSQDDKISGYINDVSNQTITNQKDIYELLYGFVNDQQIKSIFHITDSKGSSIITNSFYESPYNDYEIFLTGIFKQMKRNPQRTIRMINRVQLEGNMRTIYSIGRAISYEGETVGYIIFDLLESSWDEIIYSNDIDIIAITDPYKNAIKATNNLILDRMGKFKYKIHKHKYAYIRTAEKYYIYQSDILDGEISVFTLTSMRFINQFYFVGIIFLLILFSILTVAIVYISKSMSINKTKSIDELLHAIKAVQEGHLDFRVNITSNDEFELIGNYFNDMIVRLKALLNKNNELVNRNRMSEIMQLEAQFNPHFLFNALETLKYMIRIDTEKAVEMVVGLASLLRYSINYEDGNIYIRTDIKYIEDYLMIQKYRFNKRLEYIINIEEDTKDCVVPKLIIQPMIENAINHGYSKKEKLNIELNTFIDKNKLVLEIIDDGDGFSKERLEEIVASLSQEGLETNHIGLYNVYRRIQLLYGDQYGFHIESVQGEGTKVTIYLPILRGGECD